MTHSSANNLPMMARRRASARQGPPSPPAASARAASQAAHPPPPRVLADDPVPGGPLFCFRALLAAGILSDSVEMATRGEMHDFFAVPTRIHFTYPFAPWARPLPPPLMSCIPYVTGAAALAFGSGVAPRLGLAAFLLSAGYLFLCDAARYVNHHYLYLLLALQLLLAAVDAPASAGGRRVAPPVRRWHLSLLRLQISIMYWYGGLAKANVEFLLEHEPLRAYVRASLADGGRLHAWRLEWLLSPPALAAAAWFALLFDLAAAVALWHPRGRLAIFAAAPFFHGANTFFFSTIGSFPYVALASGVLFLEREPWCDHTTAPHEKEAVGRSVWPKSARRRLLLGTAALYACAQLTLPLRHHWMSDDVSWTRLGNDFAWRLMADTSDGWVALKLHHPRMGNATAHPMTSGAPVTLTEHAIQQLLGSAPILEQYVHAELKAACAALTHAATRQGHREEDPCLELRAYAECWKSVNGRPFQRWCDPTFDFASSPPRQWMVSPPPWMLPRLRGSEAEAEAVRASVAWRARGFKVEAFLEAAGRPAWRDRVLRSTGYRELHLISVYGSIAVATEDQSAPTAEEKVLTADMSTQLPLAVWFSIRNAFDSQPCSWIYAMR